MNYIITQNILSAGPIFLTISFLLTYQFGTEKFNILSTKVIIIVELNLNNSTLNDIILQRQQH